jgi:organic hydroperoxide reductase OsmC/OhrA
MSSQETQGPSAPKMKYKTFSYRTTLEWLGGRAGTLGSEGKPSFRAASPPEFKGEAGVWTPEDLFVASVNICTMATFAAFIERNKLPVVSYSCTAEGVIEFVDSGYRFTRLMLRPVIVLRTAEAVPLAEKTIHDAHKGCIVSNSITTRVDLEPLISVQPE